MILSVLITIALAAGLPAAAGANGFLAPCGDLRASAEDVARYCARALEAGGLKPDQLYAVAVNLGAARLDLGDAAGAADAYGRAVAVKPAGTLALAGRGRARAALGQMDGAAADWNAALRIAPDDPVLRAGRGAFRMATGDAAGALEDFDAGLRRTPKDATLGFNRAMALAALGRAADAERALDAVIARDPADIGAVLARARLRLGRDRAAALADFDRAVALAGEWPQPYVERGDLLDAMGRRDAADEDFRRAWELGYRSEALNERILRMGR